MMFFILLVYLMFFYHYQQKKIFMPYSDHDDMVIHTPTCGCLGGTVLPVAHRDLMAHPGS